MVRGTCFVGPTIAPGQRGPFKLTRTRPKRTMTDTLTPARTALATPPRSRAGLALLALAVGGFAIGTTEFVTMGLLPEVAAGTGTDIPTAGHYVSAYALGVVVGAPLIAVFAARLRRKTVLISLMVWFAVANAASGFVSEYGWLMLARFLSGFPHGAFFGIGSLVAASMVPKERRTWAVAMMLIGLGAANIVGVPLTTMLGQTSAGRRRTGSSAVSASSPFSRCGRGCRGSLSTPLPRCGAS